VIIICSFLIASEVVMVSCASVARTFAHSMVHVRPTCTLHRLQSSLGHAQKSLSLRTFSIRS
jgi:hypothetical protein